MKNFSDMLLGEASKRVNESEQQDAVDSANEDDVITYEELVELIGFLDDEDIDYVGQRVAEMLDEGYEEDEEMDDNPDEEMDEAVKHLTQKERSAGKKFRKTSAYKKLMKKRAIKAKKCKGNLTWSSVENKCTPKNKELSRKQKKIAKFRRY